MTTSGVARKESLAEILKRRSGGPAVELEGRAAAAHASLQALTRGNTGNVVDVPLDQLHPNPFQPRFHFQRRPLEELAQSLASEGQIEPVIARRVVRDGGERLEIVAGARRVEAARICDATIKPFPTVRVDVRELTDDEAERLSLIENLQRENLTPLEEGYRYWQLQQRDPKQWTVRAIADFVHKKKSTVQNRLGLVKEPAVAEAVLREHIPPTAGFHILRLPRPERESYLRAAVGQGLTVEQIKADVDRLVASQRAPVVVRPDRMRVNGVHPGHRADDDEVGAAERRGALLRERGEVMERIEALERELRPLHQRVREIDHQLAVPS